MALDACEPEIIRALEKDGWRIQDKPYGIPTDDHVLLADFVLQQATAEQVTEILVMEVKCFTNPRYDVQELYTAVGQYQVYRIALDLNKVEYPLYLALPVEAYQRLVDDRVIAAVFQRLAIKLVIVNILTEEVVQWIN